MLPYPPPVADTVPATVMLPLLCSRQLPVQLMAELPSIAKVAAAWNDAAVTVMELATMESRFASQEGLSTEATFAAEKVRFWATIVCADGSVRTVGEATIRTAKLKALLLELAVLLDELTITDCDERERLPTSAPARTPFQ